MTKSPLIWNLLHFSTISLNALSMKSRQVGDTARHRHKVLKSRSLKICRPRWRNPGLLKIESMFWYFERFKVERFENRKFKVCSWSPTDNWVLRLHLRLRFFTLSTAAKLRTIINTLEIKDSGNWTWIQSILISVWNLEVKFSVEKASNCRLSFSSNQKMSKTSVSLFEKWRNSRQIKRC